MAALRNNGGKLSWGLVCFPALAIMVRVLEFGCKEYSIDNWKNGMNKRRILESLLRHTYALLEGEINDEKSGVSHIGHVMCNAMFYSYYLMNPEKETPYDLVTDAPVEVSTENRLVKAGNTAVFNEIDYEKVGINSIMYLFKLVPTAEYPTAVAYVFPKSKLKLLKPWVEAEKLLNENGKYVRIADIDPLLREGVLIMTCERGKFIELLSSTYNYILANNLYECVEVIGPVEDDTKALMADFIVGYIDEEIPVIRLVNLWYSSTYFYEKYRRLNNKGSKISLPAIIQDLRAGKVRFMRPAKVGIIKVSQSAYDYIKEHQLYVYVKHD